MPKLSDISGPMRGFMLATGGLLLCFSVPLYHLVRFALSSGLYSHIVLIPFIGLYLVRQKRSTLPPPSAPARRWALLPFLAGSTLLAWHLFWALSDTPSAPEDSLAISTLSILLFFGGICCLFFGKETLKSIAFPLGFLLFAVPFPVWLRESLETFLQHSSAAAAYGFFKLSGTPVFNHEMVLELPGFPIEVAPECSGIHSSLALFITSLLAGYFFLRSPWKRAILAAAVVPLAILRNGVRIFTIGELCVHVGPEMINSPIHRHGGPLFFVGSLVPFFLLLFYLMRADRQQRNAKAGKRESPARSAPLA
jgi:exosortase C (VPDSG-CTERM-specific)